MKDITTFVSKTNFKPEIEMVYVKEKEGSKYAVATDTFKLIEIKLDEFCSEYIDCGWYSVSKWKGMCKAYNAKKRDIKTFESLIQENALTKEQRKNWTFPSYENIFPTEFKEFQANSEFTKEHLIEFIKILPNKDKFNYIDFSKIKDSGKMIYFENENTKIMLMKCNRS